MNAWTSVLVAFTDNDRTTGVCVCVCVNRGTMDVRDECIVDSYSVGRAGGPVMTTTP